MLFSSVPFLNANAVPGISKTVPQLPVPITAKSPCFDVDCRAAYCLQEAKLVIDGLTDLTENTLFNNSTLLSSGFPGSSGKTFGIDPVSFEHASARVRLSDTVVD